MRFWGVVLFEGDDYEAPLFRHQESFDEEEDGRIVTRRCSCTWERAAAAASEGYRERVTAVLGTGEAAPRRRGLLRRRRTPAADQRGSGGAVPTEAEILDRARRVDELWQHRMRTMVDHPEYGRADPACPECSGTGRVDDEEFEEFDYFGEPDADRWEEVLVHPCRVPRVWPWGDDLFFAFRNRLDGAPMPPTARLYPPGVLTPIESEAAATLIADDGVVPVARLLELDVVPDVVGCVDPAGRWVEHEKVETAEDLATWHARLRGLMLDNAGANAAVIDFHS